MIIFGVLSSNCFDENGEEIEISASNVDFVLILTMRVSKFRTPN